MIPYILFILVAAFLWAKLEIEIEGREGWAAGLPTWRVEKHILLDVLYGGRPLTGYHLWAFTFVCFLFHLPFFWTHVWTWRRELLTIGGYNLFWVVEDYLWFLLNPHFGHKKLNRQEVWWHKRWFLGFPVDYWLMGVVAVLLLWLGRHP